MRSHGFALVALACAGSLLLGCKAREEASPGAQEQAPLPAVASAEATQPPPPTTAPEAAPAPATPVESAAPAPKPEAPEPAPKAVQSKPAAAAPPSRPASQPPKPAEAAAPPAQPTQPPATAAPAAPPAEAPKAAPPPAPKSASGVVDPGGEIAVPATKAGLTRIGADKCKLCHKVQHASWAASAHAKRTPPLDCESCHGPGSEYKTMSVMKDLAKAKAAGLVLPDATFCQKCHKAPWDPTLLAKVHAHKARS